MFAIIVISMKCGKILIFEWMIFMSELQKLAWEFIEDNADEFAFLLLLESDEKSTQILKNLRVKFKTR